ALCAGLAFIAALRWREQVSRTLGVAALTTGAATAFATEFGYPGVTRYLIPLMPSVLVLAGIGLGRLVGLVPNPVLKGLAVVAAVAGLLAVGAPLALQRDQIAWNWYSNREENTNDIPNLIRAAGGRDALIRCGDLVFTPNAEVSAGAWAMDVKLKDVARGGLRWPAPGDRAQVDVVLASREALAREQAKRFSLNVVEIARSRNWLALWVGRAGQKPCSPVRIKAR
ncbi:MAG: hypothetical protein WCI34_07710, partial [Actinomycetes bacterium]